MIRHVALVKEVDFHRNSNNNHFFGLLLLLSEEDELEEDEELPEDELELDEEEELGRGMVTFFSCVGIFCLCLCPCLCGSRGICRPICLFSVLKVQQ